MRLFKKATVTAMALLSAGIFVSSVNASEEQVVKMYNWSDYVAEDTLENFRKERKSKNKKIEKLENFSCTIN